MSTFNAKNIVDITEKLLAASENSTKLYDAGVIAGRQTEYDAFWDNYQNYGKRRYYERAFADTTNGGRRWIDDVTYRPKYPMKPISAIGMFQYGSHSYELIKEVDFSECTDFYTTFQYFLISDSDRKFPPIDMRKATRTQNAFGSSTGIKEIEEIWVSETTPFNSVFSGTTNLEKITFKGTIAQNGLNFKDCTKLSKVSIESVIEHLSGGTSNLSVTFSEASVNKAFETSEGANDGETSAEWTALVATKPNWTITLS